MIIQLTFVWMLHLEGLAELSRCHILVGLQQFFIRWLVLSLVVDYSVNNEIVPELQVLL